MGSVLAETFFCGGLFGQFGGCWRGAVIGFHIPEPRRQADRTGGNAKIVKCAWLFESIEILEMPTKVVVLYLPQNFLGTLYP